MGKNHVENGVLSPHLPFENGLIPKHKKNIKIQRKNDISKGKVKKKENEMFEGVDVDNIPICSKCGMSKKTLKTKGTWARHLHSKHTYYCKQCPFQFTTAATLAEHERTTHPINGLPPKQKQKSGGKHPPPKKIGKHPRKKIGKHPPKKSIASKKSVLPNNCPKCGKARGDTAKSHWNKHIQTDHKYPCPQCKLRFAHKKKYNEHIKQCHSAVQNTGANDQMSVTSNSTNTTNEMMVEAEDDCIKIPKQIKR